MTQRNGVVWFGVGFHRLWRNTFPDINEKRDPTKKAREVRKIQRKLTDRYPRHCPFLNFHLESPPVLLPPLPVPSAGIILFV